MPRGRRERVNNAADTDPFGNIGSELDLIKALPLLRGRYSSRRISGYCFPISNQLDDIHGQIGVSPHLRRR